MKKQIEQELKVVCALDVEPEVVEWMWEDYLPLGEIVIFSGNADVGKGCVLCDIVSRVSRSADFPTGPCLSGGEVLMMSAEERKAKVAARLLAADADMRQIFLENKVEIRDKATKAEREFALDTDLLTLESYLKENPTIALVTIDPISAYFGSKKMNDKQEVRRIMTPLQELCSKYRITVIGVEHFNKQVGLSALHRVGGSVALTAAPRAAFMFAKMPEQEGVYAMHYIKGNDAKQKVGLTYRIEGVHIKHNGKQLKETVPHAVWGEVAEGTADDLLNATETVKQDSSLERAKKYLSKFKAPTPQETILADKPANVGRDALYQAQKILKWTARPKGKGQPWFWYPPEPETDPDSVF